MFQYSGCCTADVQCCVAVVESGCGAYDVLVTFLLSSK